MAETGDLLFGRYRVERYVARGGMGTVYAAHDQVLDQPVALKHVSFAALDAEQARETRARTLREAKLAARLRGHPQVVALYDVTESEGDVWLVMEYLPSRSLAEVLDEVGSLDPVETARIGAAVAGALAAAHAQGVVHRDVKPGNVLIGADGPGASTVKLTDFGISRAEGDQRLTAVDVVSGTPAYMAREVARGDDPTMASDVFSLGSTLYRAVEGRTPFGQDTNALRMMYRVATGHMDPPQRAGALEPLLLRLLESDPATRPDAALARDLLAEFARRPVAPTVDVPHSPYGGTGGSGGAPPTHRGPGGPGGVGTPAGPWYPGPHSGPPPGPHRPPLWSPIGPTPPVTSVGTRPWWRRPLPVVLASVLVLALMIVSIVALLPEDVSTMPDDVGPVALTGDPGTADPCALLSPDTLSRWGTAASAASFSPTGCLTQITAANGGNATVATRFDYVPGSPDNGPGTRQQVGNVTVIRRTDATSAFGERCLHEIKLTDGARIGVDVSVFRPFASACDIAETATVGVVRALRDDGIRYDPDRRDRFSFGRTDACGVLTPGELQAAVPGSAIGAGAPGLADWSCSWGAASEVTVYFSTDGPTIAAYGTETRTSRGGQAFVSPSATGCSAWVVHRTGATSELVEVDLAVPGRGGQDQCAPALDLATTAEARLPA